MPRVEIAVTKVVAQLGYEDGSFLLVADVSDETYQIMLERIGGTTLHLDPYVDTQADFSVDFEPQNIPPRNYSREEVKPVPLRDDEKEVLAQLSEQGSYNSADEYECALCKVHNKVVTLSANGDCPVDDRHNLIDRPHRLSCSECGDEVPDSEISGVGVCQGAPCKDRTCTGNYVDP